MDPQKNSYDAKVRSLARAKARQEHAFFLSFYAKLTIDETILNWKKERLQSEIDKALMNGDRESFYTLSEQYKQLVR